MRKIVFGIVWCVVFYFLACGVTGGIAGWRAGRNIPDEATAAFAGRQAGAEAVSDNWVYLLAGAVAFTVIGGSVGVLPGMRDKKQSPSDW